MSQLAPLAIAVPLVAAALLTATGSRLPAWAVTVAALGVGTATTVILTLLVVHVATQGEIYWVGGWRPRGGVALGIDIAAGPIGAGLAAFVSFLTTLGLLFGARGEDLDKPHYEALMLAFMAGMVGFCLSGDLFNMFVLFELMSIAAVGLIGYKVDEQAGVEGGLNFGVINVVGSFLFLTAIALVYGRTGALNLAQIGTALAHSGESPAIVVSFSLICAAMLVKAAAVPFHFWLADAYAVAPTPVCLVLAGAMSELGLFGIGRIWFGAYGVGFGHDASAMIGAVLVATGVLTALVGGVMALVEDHLKRMLAFMTVSFVGVFLTGLGLLSAEGVAATAVYVLADGFGKALLFACVGILQSRFGSVSAHRLAGRGRGMTATALLFLAGGLLVSSLPPFGPFLGKSMIDDAALHDGYWFVPSFVVLASALCGAAVLQSGARIFLGWGDRGGEPSPADAETEREGTSDNGRSLKLFVAFVLLAGAIATGVWFGFADLATTAAHAFVGEGAYRSAVLAGRPLRVPSGSSSSPEWFDYVYCTFAVVLAVALAAAGLWGRRFGPLARRALDRLGRAVAPLAKLHSGRVGDYLAALSLGVAVLCGLMALTLT